ncbi:hypothetical protein Rcas_4395 [Roseiflexus castenholzii DSM 13941]|uniref:Polymerase nucleotidyl transferase domain-containing protein n=1 Tax=Roseiflexus castenholzii (strain DSM 13941 / HLO8) TaxID=383372 RepID=A7NS67_ROSCS|nr:hypothetical protein Rcas_4395 [Roseiflexus castenholzii DSM 13941]
MAGESTGLGVGAEGVGKDADALVCEKRAEIPAIAAKHGAHNARIFGSVARGDTDEHSNVHILAPMEPGRSRFDKGRTEPPRAHRRSHRRTDPRAGAGRGARGKRRILATRMPTILVRAVRP